MAFDSSRVDLDFGCSATLGITDDFSTSADERKRVFEEISTNPRPNLRFELFDVDILTAFKENLETERCFLRILFVPPKA